MVCRTTISWTDNDKKQKRKLLNEEKLKNKKKGKIRRTE
jgi:hypothetical protein